VVAPGPSDTGCDAMVRPSWVISIAPDRAELLFEAGQLNTRLDKRRAAITAFERFLAVVGSQGDPELRQRATALLQELRRGLN